MNTAEQPIEEVEEVDAPDEEVSELRADLNAALDEHDEDTSDDDETPAPESSEAPQGEETPPDDVSAEGEQEQPSRTVRTDKAPVAWKGGEWDKLDEQTREYVANRERDISMLMQNTAQERKVAKQFADTITRYREPLEQLGYNDPFTAIDSVMSAAAGMRAGTPAQRARVAADVLQTFGIDIGELDSALAAAGVGATPAQDTSHIEQMLDKRLAPVNQLMQQMEASRAQHAQQAQAQTQDDVANFIAANEFADQVRNEMADLLDMAAQRGQQLSMKDAYDRACMMHPDISKTLIERQYAEKANAAREATQAKKNAASSISGTPSGAGAKPATGSISDDLNQAWDDIMAGR